MRLAYADPPYPGMAHLYPENAEVDHGALIRRLGKYDGWALSTDERSLALVLSLCTALSERKVRVLAWCRSNAPPFAPNPWPAWEPVLAVPARTQPVTVPSYYVGGVPNGKRQRDGLTGQKTPGFCEWVIRCLGAEADDDLDDLFPGTGTMGETWRRFCQQPPLFAGDACGVGAQARENRLKRFHPQLDGMPTGRQVRERQNFTSSSHPNA